MGEYPTKEAKLNTFQCFDWVRSLHSAFDTLLGCKVSGVLASFYLIENRYSMIDSLKFDPPCK